MSARAVNVNKSQKQGTGSSRGNTACAFPIKDSITVVEGSISVRNKRRRVLNRVEKNAKVQQEPMAAAAKRSLLERYEDNFE
ncbi:hypothetical protein Tco_0733275 [Tanacetum coccineum]